MTHKIAIASAEESCDDTDFSNIGDSLLTLFWIFVLIAYLSALFSVVWDLVPDRRLNEWWKAIWMVFLLFVPVLTALFHRPWSRNGRTTI